MIADDTSLQSNNTTAVELVDTLQVSVTKLIKWTQLNHTTLNSSKTTCMYVSTRQKRKQICFQCPSLFIEDEMIEQVTSHKILVVTIDNDLSWSEHFTLLGKRLSQKYISTGTDEKSIFWTPIPGNFSFMRTFSLL